MSKSSLYVLSSTALAFYRDLLGLEVVVRLDPDNSGPEGSIAAGLNIAGMLVPGGTMLELVEFASGASSNYENLDAPSAR